MFLDAGNVIPESTKSRNGSSRNDSWYFAVHAKLGSLPIEAILKPVIELAERRHSYTETRGTESLP
jgi:gamma-glutamyltranspeptidase/glutathione hydrolase